MKKLCAFGLAAVLLGALAQTADACHRDCGGCAPACAPAPCQVQVTYVDKVVTCYRPKLVETEVKCIVNKVVCREVVEERKVCVNVPVWSERKCEVTVCRMVPEEVVRNVTCVKRVPVCVTDPCTGCTYTTYKCETVTQQVKQIVCKPVYEKKEVVQRVCSFKQEERTVQCRRIVAECHPEEVTRKVCRCVMEAYQTTVKVPVCTVVPAPPCK